MSNKSKKIWDAKEYGPNSSPQYKAAIDFLSHYPFKGNERVLDIGSGDGKITAFLANKIPQGKVIGIDSSESMVKFAQNTHKHSNLIFLQNDVQSLNYRDEFDLIMSNFCLHWVPNKELAFQNIATALKPGGFLMTLISIRNYVAAKIRDEMTQEVKWNIYFQDFFDSSTLAQEHNYDKYLLKANLHIIKSTIEEKKEHYKSKAQLRDFFKAITPHLDNLPAEHLKNEFIEEFTDRYVKIYGAFAFPYTYIKLLAQGTV
jgi:trans-aconitate 2-methyltransferase